METGLKAFLGLKVYRWGLQPTKATNPGRWDEPWQDRDHYGNGSWQGGLFLIIISLPNTMGDKLLYNFDGKFLS